MKNSKAGTSIWDLEKKTEKSKPFYPDTERVATEPPTNLQIKTNYVIEKTHINRINSPTAECSTIYKVTSQAPFTKTPKSQ